MFGNLKNVFLCCNFHFFMHCSPDCSEHLYYHYFKLFVWEVTYLLLIKVGSWKFMLFFGLEHIPFFLCFP